MKRLLPLLLCVPAFACADIHYTLEPMTAAKSVRVAVTMDSSGVKEVFRIPAWTPGMYELMKYQEKVSDVKAANPDGGVLTVTPTLDKRGWEVANPTGKPITVSYRVLGDDPGLGFFGVNVNDKQAYVNGAAAFMYVDGHLTDKTTLALKLPIGWDVATAMEPGSGGWKADGYDEFIDHPLQLGEFTRKRFTVEGVPFEAIFVAPDGQIRCNPDVEAERLRKLSIPTMKMFHGSAFKKYLYIIHLSIGNFSGGLEHRACNVQAVSNVKPLNLDELAVHEYVHAWNVKQIRPKVLGPFDYTKECRTGNLWFAEGVTDYYGTMHTYASGVLDEAWLLGALGQQVSDLEHGKTRLTKTVEDSSRETWDNGGFGVGDLSYYTKGLLIGWIFDAEIRSLTHGAKSLDDVMRLLYARCKLPNPGYDEDGLMATINEVAGKDLSGLYRDMVRSTKGLPYGLLKDLGMLVITPGQEIPGGNGAKADQFMVVKDPDASAKVSQLRSAWLKRP